MLFSIRMQHMGLHSNGMSRCLQILLTDSAAAAGSWPNLPVPRGQHRIDIDTNWNLEADISLLIQIIPFVLAARRRRMRCIQCLKLLRCQCQ
jgi:hypothetical protein